MMTPLEIIGCILIGYILLKVILSFISFLWRSIRCRDYLKRLQQLNDYAIVTGSTDGIGLEYARQLAAYGFNILLLSRSEDKLANVAAELEQDYPGNKIETLAVDFSKLDIYGKIGEKIESLDGNVSVLVNNVGFAYHLPEYFHKMPPNLNQDIIVVNCISCTSMIELVLKSMVKQKRGLIINVSSFSGVSNFPLFATYSATKAFMNSLGNSLAVEFEENNILMQTVIPNQVETKAAKDLHQPMLSVKAKDLVRHSLKRVGHEQMTSAHPWHKFINSTFLLMDYIFGERIMNNMKLSACKDMIQKYNQRQ